jgi:hypothetical protein
VPAEQDCSRSSSLTGGFPCPAWVLLARLAWRYRSEIAPAVMVGAVLDTRPHTGAIPRPGQSASPVTEPVNFGPFEDGGPC